jgi:hypothetical protein
MGLSLALVEGVMALVPGPPDLRWLSENIRNPAELEGIHIEVEGSELVWREIGL